MFSFRQQHDKEKILNITENEKLNNKLPNDVTRAQVFKVSKLFVYRVTLILEENKENF